MIYDYDFTNKLIDIPLAIKTINVIDLLGDIRLAEATEEGIQNAHIADASGKETLGGEVAVGVTVNLLDEWQVRFAAGEYVATVSGGNLVGGLDGNPIAYSTGVQVLNIQSAASTVVTTSDGVSASDRALIETAAANNAEAVWAELIGTELSASAAIREINTNTTQALADIADIAIDGAPTNVDNEAIAAAVWDATTGSHTTADTFGGELAQKSDTSTIDTSAISGAVWSYDPNSDGTTLNKLDQITSDASSTRKHTINKAVISGDERTVTIYDDDLTTVLFEFDVSFDKKVRTPR